MTQPRYDLTRALSKTHAFMGLEAQQLRLIEPLVTLHHFSASDVVVAMNSRECDLYVVLEGRLRVLGPGEEILAELGPGASVGEIALLDQQPRSATVVATENSTVAVIPAMDLWMLMDRRPELGSTILFNIGRVLASRLRSANGTR